MAVIYITLSLLYLDSGRQTSAPHIPVELLQPAEQRHGNTTTFEQQLASCALTPATFIDNFGSVRPAAKPRGHSRSGIQVWFAAQLVPIYKTREELETVGSVACASAQATLPPLGGVASLGLPRLGNPGNRGMEATLGLRAPPTPL